MPKVASEAGHGQERAYSSIVLSFRVGRDQWRDRQLGRELTHPRDNIMILNYRTLELAVTKLEDRNTGEEKIVTSKL